MNIHQKTSNRHRVQLTSTAYCRNKTVWHYFAVAIVLIFSMSAMATSRPKSKHKYRIRRIPEVILDSTIYEAIHRAIPALEAHNSKPFTWMVFSTKSMYACDTTTNLVGAVWAIKKGQRRSSVDGLTEYPADAVHKEGKIGDSVQLRSKAF